MPKILFDARRKLNSGIGRVSQWIINEVLKEQKEIEVYYLTTEECVQNYQLPIEKSIITNFKPFSTEEFYEIPKLTFKGEFDCFFSPQFNCSPFHFSSTINIIHDLWYILNHEFIPNESDINFRFNNNDTHFAYVSRWLDKGRQELFLTEYGIKLFKNSKSEVHKYLWCQLTMISAYSSQIVFVNSFLQDEFEKIFTRKNNLHVIWNGYNEFLTTSVHIEEPIHFLCMAKLEERKNLNYLVDEFCEYTNKSKIKLKLVIAGDKGYESYNSKFLNRLYLLKLDGYPIEFIENANDLRLIELFSKARAIIVTSKYESFGLPAIEAIAANVELISTRTGIIAKGFENYVNFFEIEPGQLSKLLLLSDLNVRIKPTPPRNFLKSKIDNNEIRTSWQKLLKNVL